jgi:hypothetical protein
MKVCRIYNMTFQNDLKISFFSGPLKNKRRLWFPNNKKSKLKRFVLLLVTYALVHSTLPQFESQQTETKTKKINFSLKKVNLTNLSDVPEPDLGVLLSIDVGLVVDNAHQIP